jgi:hypothetical protein
MSSHASHRQEGRKHKHHRPLQRGSVIGSFPAARSQDLDAALRQALDDLEAERLRTTGRTNPADDDEDPTRRASAPRA